MVDMSVVERGMKNKQILALYFVPASAFFQHVRTNKGNLTLPTVPFATGSVYFFLFFLLC